MSRSKTSFVAILTLFLLVAAVARAEAQTWEVTPNIGMYIPVGLLIESRDATDNTLIRHRQLGALLIGARFGVRPGRTFGLEGSVSFSPTMVAITDRESTQDIGGSVLMASMRGVTRMSGEFARGQWALYAAPGIGIVRRAGNAWAGTAGTTDPSVVVAAGARLGRLNSGKAFRFDVENYVTRASFDYSGTMSDPRLHHDVVWSFGISLPVSR